MKKRNLTILLLALCLTLAACGGKRDGPAPLAADGVYTADILPLELPLTELTASAAGNRNLYLAGPEEEEPEEPLEDGEDVISSSFSFTTTAGEDGGFTFSTGLGRAALYRLDLASGEAVKLAGYASEEDGASVQTVVACPDGTLWVLEQTDGMGTLDLDSLSTGGIASVDFGTLTAAGQVWRHLSEDGSQELERVDVMDLVDRLGAETVTDTRMDASGRLYAACGSTVTALDTDLTVRFTCQCPEPVERLAALADGGVGAVTGDGESRTLYPVDPEAGALGAACPLTGSARDVYAGNERHGFLYRSGDSLYGWPQGGTAPEKILSWSGAGLDCGQVAAVALQADGQGAALLREVDSWPATFSLARLAPAGEEALAGRTVLTLATLGMSSETRARVLEFNRTNSQYRIEVRDYSEYNVPGSVSAGLTKLNTEILAGNMPDLLDVSDSLPLRRYAARGMLEDLWPFIESDPDLGRAGVMERVLEADEIGGKLCRVFPRFALETAAGAPDLVGEKTGWTLEELKAALAKQPADCGVIGAGETKSSILESLFADILDRFVDWGAGTASFDSQEFREILEFCNTFPAQARDAGEDLDAYTRVARGEQLLLPVYLNDLSSIQIYRALFGGGVSFVGYPSSQRTGVRFIVDGGIALSSACEDKVGAWSFLRQALLPRTAETFALDFPVNRADFEKEAQESMKVEYVTDEDGNQIIGHDGKPIKEGMSYVFIDGQLIAIESATQEDYDQ
ncbi:MAG: hypothetical protein K2N78_05030, partial [Oscillospiraceae bacterium]|nr:hypothetical protein [Oscillospiraceae bacterium]